MEPGSGVSLACSHTVVIVGYNACWRMRILLAECISRVGAKTPLLKGRSSEESAGVVYVVTWHGLLYGTDMV